MNQKILSIGHGLQKKFREKYVMRRDSNYLGANPPSTWDWASTKADGRDKGHPSLSSSIYLYTVNSNFHINLQYLILLIFYLNFT